MFTYLKNFMSLTQKIKKFEFWRARLVENPHRGILNFVTFSLLLITTHFENLICLVVAV